MDPLRLERMQHWLINTIEKQNLKSVSESPATTEHQEIGTLLGKSFLNKGYNI